MMPAAVGPEDPLTGLRTVRQGSMAVEGTDTKVKLLKCKPKLYLLEAVWPSISTYILCAS